TARSIQAQYPPTHHSTLRRQRKRIRRATNQSVPKPRPSARRFRRFEMSTVTPTRRARAAAKTALPAAQNAAPLPKLPLEPLEHLLAAMAAVGDGDFSVQLPRH